MSYQMVKVFDLSEAPVEIRDSDDMAPLRLDASDDSVSILTLKVGQFVTPSVGKINESLTREITLTEYRLHQWLAEQGATKGESVLLRWKGGADW